MKAEVKIWRDSKGFYALIEINHDFLDPIIDQNLISCFHKSKGQLKRKAIQFCADLNLECEFVS